MGACRSLEASLWLQINLEVNQEGAKLPIAACVAWCQHTLEQGDPSGALASVPLPGLQNDAVCLGGLAVQNFQYAKEGRPLLLQLLIK